MTEYARFRLLAAIVEASFEALPYLKTCKTNDRKDKDLPMTKRALFSKHVVLVLGDPDLEPLQTMRTARLATTNIDDRGRH